MEKDGKDDLINKEDISEAQEDSLIEYTSASLRARLGAREVEHFKIVMSSIRSWVRVFAFVALVGWGGFAAVVVVVGAAKPDLATLVLDHFFPPGGDLPTGEIEPMKDCPDIWVSDLPLCVARPKRRPF